MTLIELMTALVILALGATLVFTHMGAWLERSRLGAEEASYWRSTSSTRFLLSELTTSAIDPSTRVITPTQARFRAYLPRLAPAPIEATLAISNDAEGARLSFQSPPLRESTLMESPEPLRFRGEDTLILEAQTANGWCPIAIGAFPADSALTCVYDIISRVCR